MHAKSESDRVTESIRLVRRLVRWTIWFGLLAGVLLRLLRYQMNRSLWLDEAMLASCLFPDRPWISLDVLPYGQVVPPGFLVMIRCFAEFTGLTECGLRLPVLLGGIATLLLLPALGRALKLPRIAIGFGVLLFAFSEQQITYAVEFKQYGWEALIATLLVLFYARSWDLTNRRDQMAAMVAGMFAVWFAHTAVIVLAAVGIVELVKRRSLPQAFRNLVLPGIGWLLSFGVCYFLFYREPASRDYLQSFHAESFVPLPSSVAAIQWYNFAFFNFFRGSIGWTERTLFLGIFLFGAGILLNRRRIPFVATLAALCGVYLVLSMAHRYPWGDRFAVFTGPFVALATGAGFSGMIQILRRRSLAVAILLPALGLMDPVYRGVLIARERTSWVKNQETRMLLDDLDSRIDPKDRLYFCYPSAAIHFYLQAFPRSFSRVRNATQVEVAESDWHNPADLMQQLDDHGGWLLITFARPDDFVPFEEKLKLAAQIDVRIEKPGAYAFHVRPRPGTRQ